MMHAALRSFVFAFLLLAAPLAQAAETATATVERLNAALLAVMQEAEALGYQGRYDRLAPELTEIFDFPAMARVSLGSQWKKLDPPQQEAFTEAFADYSIAVFAARFDGFSGESFEVTGEREARRGSVVVLNQLVKSDGEIIAINYLARPDKEGGNWRLVDTFLDAKYSEMAARRSEYSGFVKRDGVDALIATLNEKVAGYAVE